MKKRTIAILSSVSLTIVLAAFTGSALAGNGNGNGNSQATSAGQSASPNLGNSANAPGHTKDTTATTASTQDTGASAQNAGATPGVKPANNTAKGTSCTTGGSATSATCGVSASGATANVVGAARPDASKRYGSGQTAAQIAVSRGGSGVTLFGPGNSQPHKVQACPGSSHMVDVHAVKSYSTTSCATTTPVVMPTVTPTVAGTTVVTTQIAQGASATAPGQTVAATTPAGTNAATGGVLGTTASTKASPQGGVLGALASVGHGQLPFTGFPLWIAVAIAAAMVVSGLALRRRGHATV